MTHHIELWSLREDVRVEAETADGAVVLRSHWGEVIVRQPSGHVREALHRMCLGPISLENVIDGRPGESDRALRHLHQVLGQLQPLIIRSLGQETGQPLLSVVPITPRSRFQLASLAPDARVRLSSFAQLRTDGNLYVLESPLALHRVLIHRPEAACLIGALGRFVTIAEAAANVGQRDSVVAGMLEYLAAAGMITTAQPARQAMGMDRPPSVLITLTARFRLVSWKYGSCPRRCGWRMV